MSWGGLNGELRAYRVEKHACTQTEIGGACLLYLSLSLSLITLTAGQFTPTAGQPQANKHIQSPTRAFHQQSSTALLAYLALLRLIVQVRALQVAVILHVWSMCACEKTGPFLCEGGKEKPWFSFSLPHTHIHIHSINTRPHLEGDEGGVAAVVEVVEAGERQHGHRLDEAGVGGLLSFGYVCVCVVCKWMDGMGWDDSSDGMYASRWMNGRSNQARTDCPACYTHQQRQEQGRPMAQQDQVVEHAALRVGLVEGLVQLPRVGVRGAGLLVDGDQDVPVCWL